MLRQRRQGRRGFAGHRLFGTSGWSARRRCAQASSADRASLSSSSALTHRRHIRSERRAHDPDGCAAEFSAARSFVRRSHRRVRAHRTPAPPSYSCITLGLRWEDAGAEAAAGCWGRTLGCHDQWVHPRGVPEEGEKAGHVRVPRPSPAFASYPCSSHPYTFPADAPAPITLAFRLTDTPRTQIRLALGIFYLVLPFRPFATLLLSPPPPRPRPTSPSAENPASGLSTSSAQCTATGEVDLLSQSLTPCALRRT
ncbi:hypothetical protein C2E23DRAFT_607070 [Lenzites betulinus]|nr:hypothetical protein C2E23DRAFT_607070 [Lenzites betulinus]